ASLCRLQALRQAYETADLTPAIGGLVWLAITSILRETSGVGTAQWQYLLPKKSKAKTTDPFTAFRSRIQLFAADMRAQKRQVGDAQASLRLSDARNLKELGDLAGRVGLVLTSPPYPNNFDYADATRLEMTFWGEIASWGDLQDAVRRRLVRSCS